ARTGLGERGRELVGIVADDRDAHRQDADRLEPAGDPGGVRVDRAAVQQLVADREHFGARRVHVATSRAARRCAARPVSTRPSAYSSTIGTAISVCVTGSGGVSTADTTNMPRIT